MFARCRAMLLAPAAPQQRVAPDNDVAQPSRGERLRQGSSPGQFGAPGFEQPHEQLVHGLERRTAGGVGGLRRQALLQVELLQYQPSSRLQAGDQAVQDGLSVGQVHQHQTGVDQVEVLTGRVVVHHVVHADHDVVAFAGVDPAGVDVGDQHGAVLSDAVGQPPPDTAVAGPDLPALQPAVTLVASSATWLAAS
jgi:hypothetical protein